MESVVHVPLKREGIVADDQAHPSMSSPARPKIRKEREASFSKCTKNRIYGKGAGPRSEIKGTVKCARCAGPRQQRLRKAPYPPAAR